jgi:ring-1,2-phenylacetyl-CoA epoxidase subunit PaaD
VDVARDRITVEILPTFVGCPALDVIRASIADRLETRFEQPVRVDTTYAVPWTSDRISGAGRAALRRPASRHSDPADVRCPHCSSANVAMDSAFWPTQCRSLFLPRVPPAIRRR